MAKLKHSLPRVFLILGVSLLGQVSWAIRNSDEALSLLGLQRGASTAQIVQAFRKRSVSVHPDALAARGATEAERSAGEAKFKELNEARQFLLGSPLSRTGQTTSATTNGNGSRPSSSSRPSTAPAAAPVRVPPLGALRGLRLFVDSLAVDYARNAEVRRQVIENMFGDLSHRRHLAVAFSYDELAAMFSGPAADRSAEVHVKLIELLRSEGVSGTLLFFAEVLEVLNLVEDDPKSADAQRAVELLRQFVREEAEKAVEAHPSLAEEYPSFLRALASSNPDLSLVDRSGLRVRALFGACENFMRRAFSP